MRNVVPLILMFGCFCADTAWPQAVCSDLFRAPQNLLPAQQGAKSAAPEIPAMTRLSGFVKTLDSFIDPTYPSRRNTAHETERDWVSRSLYEASRDLKKYLANPSQYAWPTDLAGMLIHGSMLNAKDPKYAGDPNVMISDFIEAGADGNVWYSMHEMEDVPGGTELKQIYVTMERYADEISRQPHASYPDGASAIMWQTLYFVHMMNLFGRGLHDRRFNPKLVQITKNLSRIYPSLLRHPNTSVQLQIALDLRDFAENLDILRPDQLDDYDFSPHSHLKSLSNPRGRQ